MKNLKILFPKICLLLLIFSSCKKQEFQNNDLCKITKLSGPWLKHKVEGPTSYDCRRGGFFCQERIWQDCLNDDFHEINLSDGDVAGTGEVISDDHFEIVEFNFTKHNLDRESVNLILEERFIELENFQLDPQLMDNIYTNMGIPFHGKEIHITEGKYPINITESPDGSIPNFENLKIKIRVEFRAGATNIVINLYS